MIKPLIIFILTCLVLSLIKALPDIIWSFTYLLSLKRLNKGNNSLYAPSDDSSGETYHNTPDMANTILKDEPLYVYPSSSEVPAPYIFTEEEEEELLKQIPSDDDDIEFRDDLDLIIQDIAEREEFDKTFSEIFA